MELKKINPSLFIIGSLVASYIISGGIITFLNKNKEIESYSSGILFFILLGLFFLSSMAFRFLNKAAGIVIFVIAIIYTGIQMTKKPQNSSQNRNKGTI